jgi:fatty acid elongase 3
LPFWYYIFYVSKIYEFLDTYIQIFKQKQPPFLHTWHHCTTLTVVWATVTTEISIQWLSIGANAFVHIFMYCYYFLASLEFPVWWKRYLTKLQIIQFVLTISINLYWLYGYHYEQCSGNVWAWSYGMFIITTFLFLFIRFYQDSYKRGKKPETSTSNGGDAKATNGASKHHKYQ